MEYLSSWFTAPLASTGQPAGPATKAPLLTPVELAELHAKYQTLTHQNAVGMETFFGKIVAENNELKRRWEDAERELRMWKAGRAEEEKELKKLRKEVASKQGGDKSNKNVSAVVILDFELDMFTPLLFHRSENAGRAAARNLRDKIRESLPSDFAGSNGVIMTFIFLRRSPELLADLMAEGMVSSQQELSEFIASFNRAHPLYMMLEMDCEPDVILQRQRALAAVYCRFDQCRRLILGRWALDLPLAELLAPTTAATANVEKPANDSESQKGKSKGPKFPPKVQFIEPFPGTWIDSSFRARDPKIVQMRGVIRRIPLRRGMGAYGPPQINFDRPLNEQDPPICLAYYLSPNRCPREDCTFCHAYQLPQAAVNALRLDVTTTPCAIQYAGVDCPLSREDCFFAHTCSRGVACPRRSCPFPPHMHPPMPTPDPTPAPTPLPTSRPYRTSPQKPPYVSPVRPAAAAPAPAAVHLDNPLLFTPPLAFRSPLRPTVTPTTKVASPPRHTSPSKNTQAARAMSPTLVKPSAVVTPSHEGPSGPSVSHKQATPHVSPLHTTDPLPPSANPPPHAESAHVAQPSGEYFGEGMEEQQQQYHDSGHYEELDYSKLTDEEIAALEEQYRLEEEQYLADQAAYERDEVPQGYEDVHGEGFVSPSGGKGGVASPAKAGVKASGLTGASPLLKGRKKHGVV